MKKILGNTIFVTLLFALPLSVSAEVVISEIAWMGADGKSSDEWVEIFNTSENTVNLTEWSLEVGGDSIHLNNTIDGQGFYVIAFDSKESFDLSFSVDQYASGALTNGGEEIVLKDGLTEIQTVELVDGEWAAGNDETYNTMTRKGSAWITAEPTPGAENATVDLEKADEESGSSSGHSDGGNDSDASNGEDDSSDEEEETTDDDEISSHLSPVSIKDFHPVFTLTTDAGRERIGTPNTPMLFDARAATSGESLLEDARFSWTFGDGYEKRGEKVKHTFHFSGEYQVVLHTAYNDHRAVDRTAVIIYPLELSIVGVKTGEDGYVALVNGGTDEVNIGGYTLESEAGSFEFPEDTIIGAGDTIKFSNALLDLSLEEEVRFFYPNNELAFEYNIVGSEDDGKVLGAHISRIELKLEEARKKLGVLMEKMSQKKQNRPQERKGETGRDLPQDTINEQEKESSEMGAIKTKQKQNSQDEKRNEVVKKKSVQPEDDTADFQTIAVVHEPKSFWEKILDFAF